MHTCTSFFESGLDRPIVHGISQWLLAICTFLPRIRPYPVKEALGRVYSHTIRHCKHCVQGRMGAEWLDETDCVGSWQNERLAAVIFPTADTLTKVRQLARVKGPHRLMLLINPQWQTDGQVVSDFGYVLGFQRI